MPKSGLRHRVCQTLEFGVQFLPGKLECTAATKRHLRQSHEVERQWQLGGKARAIERLDTKHPHMHDFTAQSGLR